MRTNTTAPAQAHTERAVLSFKPSDDPQKTDKRIMTYTDGSTEEWDVIWRASGPDDYFGRDSEIN